VYLAKIDEVAMNSKAWIAEVADQILLSESQEEKNAVAQWVVEHFLQQPREQLLRGREVAVDEVTRTAVQAAIDRINRYEPVQYVLGEAWFYGRKFLVNNQVLIPRPETELLVDIVKAHAKPPRHQQIQVVDLCTGSGCIGITLACELPQARVHVTDISHGAIHVAAMNARAHRVALSLKQHDVLTESLDESVDVMVSNPPYVLQREKRAMQKQVLEHEPAQALFVPDEDPLRFYKPLAALAAQRLLPGGLVAVEVNPLMAADIQKQFETVGLREVAIHMDLDGRPRVVCGRHA
jgi:release factor glutamine methyltransferase